MKKIYKYLVLFLFVFVLSACDLDEDIEPFKIQINGVQGISDITVDSSKNTISFDVAATVTTFDLKGIQTGYDAIEILPVSNDTVINNSVVDLLDGKNEFTIQFSGTIEYLGRDVTVSEDWTLTIYKLSTATISSIEIYEWKTEYFVGEAFEEGKLKVTWSDESQTITDLKSSMVTNFNTSKTGDVDVYIEYGGKVILTTITILSLDANLESISVYSWSNTFKLNDEFKEGLLMLTYSNGYIHYVKLTEDMVTGFDTSVEGEYSITISYLGKEVQHNIIVVDNSLSEEEQADLENTKELLIKFVLFLNCGVVEGDDDYEEYFDEFYKDLDEESDEYIIQLLNESNVSNEDVLNGLSILDRNLSTYRDAVYDIYDMIDEEDAFILISDYLFEDWDNHMSVINEITDLLTSEQIADLITISFYILDFNYNNLSFEEFKSFASEFKDGTDIIDTMQKYYELSDNSYYGSKTQWLTIINTTKNLIKVITNYEKEDIKLVVDTINVLIYDLENVKTSDLTKSINIIGELSLELYDVLPEYDFLTNVFNQLFSIDLFYPKEMIKVLALVCIDFTADEMLEIIDVLNSEYAIIEITKILSNSILNNIDVVYGDDFETELVKYLSNIDFIDINKAAEFADDLYSFFVNVNETTLTDITREELNNDLANLIDSLSGLITNNFNLNVYGSDYDSFIVDGSLSMNEFYSYLNQNSNLYYKDVQINFSSDICSSVDLSKSGTQYLVVNIDGDILEVPVYVVNDTIDLEVTYYYTSFEDNTIDGNVYVNQDGEFVHNEYNNLDQYIRVNIIYYDREDNVYYKYYVNDWVHNYTNLDLIIDDLSVGEQKAILSVNLFANEYIYIPLDVYVCAYNQEITTKLTQSNTLYASIATVEDVKLTLYTYYLNSNNVVSVTSVTIDYNDFTILSEIDFNKSYYGDIEVVYNDKVYELYFNLRSVINYLVDSVNVYNLPCTLVLGSSYEEIYLSVDKELPNSIPYKYFYIITLKDYIDYADTLGVEIIVEDFDSSTVGNRYYKLIYKDGNYSSEYKFNYSIVSSGNYINISTIQKISSYDYMYNAYFDENMLSVDDAIDINNGVNLQKYKIRVNRNNTLVTTYINLADFVRLYDAEVYIDIDNEKLVVSMFDQEMTVNINILHNVVPYGIDVYDSYNCYYDVTDRIGYLYVSINYREASTYYFYGYEVKKIALNDISNIDTSQSGYQIIEVNVYGINLECEIYIYANYEFSHIQFNTQEFIVGVDDINDFALSAYEVYTSNGGRSKSVPTTITNYEIKDLIVGDFDQKTGLTTYYYTVTYNDADYYVSFNVYSMEYYLFSIIYTNGYNKVLLDSDIYSSNITLNRYIDGAEGIRGYEYFYNNYYQISIEDFIAYAEGFDVDVAIVNYQINSLGEYTMKINIGSYSLNLNYLVVDNLYDSNIVPYLLTRNYSTMNDTDIQNIINGINLDEYNLTYIKYAYYHGLEEFNSISLLELKYEHNASFSIVEDKLVMTLYGITYYINE